VGRVYRYEDEAACDRHVGVFERAVETAGSLPGPGFAAIKVTALGNPLLLERMSSALLQVRELFQAGDTDGEGGCLWAGGRMGWSWGLWNLLAFL
jgi:proline dehydrogenase